MAASRLPASPDQALYQVPAPAVPAGDRIVAMNELDRPSRSRISRRSREDRAYRLVLATGAFGTIAIVGIALAIFGVVSWGISCHRRIARRRLRLPVPASRVLGGRCQPSPRSSPASGATTRPAARSSRATRRISTRSSPRSGSGDAQTFVDACRAAREAAGGVGRHAGAGPRPRDPADRAARRAATRRRWPGSSRARSASPTPSRWARCRRSSTPATSSSPRAGGCTARPCRARCPTRSSSPTGCPSASWP